MEEKKKKFAKVYRIAIWVWVVIANAILHAFHIEHSWIIFISNIMFFTMHGDNPWKKLRDVMCGAAVGMLISYVLFITIAKAKPVIGDMPGYLIPLAIAMFLLIYVHPILPTFLNNVGFAYLVVCAINPQGLIANPLQYFLTLLIGGGIFNVVVILMAKPIKKLVFKEE